MKNTITAKDIMKKIRGNERFSKIVETVKVMSDKYGTITAAGGSLVDCYFNKDFYDIDLFISIEDLKDEVTIAAIENDPVLKEAYQAMKELF